MSIYVYKPNESYQLHAFKGIHSKMKIRSSCIPSLYNSNGWKYIWKNIVKKNTKKNVVLLPILHSVLNDMMCVHKWCADGGYIRGRCGWSVGRVGRVIKNAFWLFVGGSQVDKINH